VGGCERDHAAFAAVHPVSDVHPDTIFDRAVAVAPHHCAAALGLAAAAAADDADDDLLHAPSHAAASQQQEPGV